MTDRLITVQIESSAPDGSLVRGWANVTSIEGNPVVDFEGDIIPIEILRDAVHRFIASERISLVTHNGKKVGEIVESVIIDDYFANAVGMSDKRRGWWVGMAVYDETVKADVVKGKLRAFSIGGKALRVPIEEGMLQ